MNIIKISTTSLLTVLLVSSAFADRAAGFSSKGIKQAPVVVGQNVSNQSLTSNRSANRLPGLKSASTVIDAKSTSSFMASNWSDRVGG